MNWSIREAAMNWSIRIAIVAGTFTVIAMAYSLGKAPPAVATSQPPAGAGLDLINERCGFCHTSSSVFAKRKTRAGWTATVQAMADRGADVSTEEMKTIVDYLTTHYALKQDANGVGARGEDR